ncbi:hypothetical protein [Bacillus solimangrovi]|uniref:Uncharacterized protein n=1 Tax=Bacillus solimangrovi TaxID=1305675 RepID=A0A1E5LDC2_9BACI|nr:hypothetical protein [Bacillus solimangrovi]OEH92086.1 hypothetical protein BFG57_16780 [Bacillus solimangrovi]
MKIGYKQSLLLLLHPTQEDTILQIKNSTIRIIGMLKLKITRARILPSKTDKTSAVTNAKKSPNEKNPNAIPAPVQEQQVVSSLSLIPILSPPYLKCFPNSI